MIVPVARALVVLIACFSFTAACSTPKGSANARQILAGAQAEDADFAVYPVQRDTVGRIAEWPGSTQGALAAAGWIANDKGPASSLIAAGDRVDVTVWETGEGTLLTLPGQRVVALPGLTVAPDGSVFLPFVDKVYIAKMTPDEARETIQTKMAPFAPAAQVLLTHQPGRKSTVDLISGVPQPGSYPLPDRNFTVTSLLAMGGGIPRDLQNPFVRLMRDGKIYSVSADRLLKDPSLDTTLRGGDKVYVESDERYFLALGAAGREAQLPFIQDRITAMDALAQIGGLNEARADAKGILVLRDYPASAIRSDGTGPSKERVVFVLDLTSADGLFSAGEFTLQHKDVVMVTESPVTSAQTVMAIVASVFGVARTAQVLGE